MLSKSILIAAAAAAALSACTPYRSGSESVVSSNSVGRVANVERCRVLAVREITIRDEDPRGVGTVSGAIAGGLVGRAVGNEIGGGSGQDLARALGTLGGALAGGAVGENIDQNRGQRPGLEYSVIDAGGNESIIVQEFLEGDRIAQPGTTCRIEENTRTGVARILPGEGLPGVVAAPQRTQVSY